MSKKCTSNLPQTNVQLFDQPKTVRGDSLKHFSAKLGDTFGNSNKAMEKAAFDLNSGDIFLVISDRIPYHV